MADWGGGYVTDVNYIPGYYLQQSPVHMAAAARLVGVACDLPDNDDTVHYLELGCGLGLVSLILAASNPAWRVTGIDFNPAHIATARALARQAGIANVGFIEADLTELVKDLCLDRGLRHDIFVRDLLRRIIARRLPIFRTAGLL